MTEKEKNIDRMFQELIQESEFMEAPPGMNEKIMQQVMKLESKEKKSLDFLRPAWILLLIAVIILPLFIKLVPGMISPFIGSEIETISLSASNFSFVVMVIFAGALLLIAEQLISVGFMNRG
jgi:hypothetical protein